MNTSYIFTSLIALAAFALLAFSPMGPTKTYTVDTDASTLTWVGEKVTGKHNGSLKLKKGKFTFADAKLTGGDFEIDMTSITVDDLEGEWGTKLLGHLQSDDFFSVSTYPTAAFKITQVAPGAEGSQYTVTGDLSIKGKTNPVSFDVTATEKDGKMLTSGTATIDRTQYGIRYGSGTFFDNLGDKTISDNFELSFNVVSK